MSSFEFFRFRFHFRAHDPIHFPRGRSANVVRGGFGATLRQSATPEAYARLFEPGAALGKAPSGLADWPRPLVFRVAHLDGLLVPAGSPFFVDIHVFDLRSPVLPILRAAFVTLAARGIGPGRGRADFLRAEQLTLDERAFEVTDEPRAPASLPLDADPVSMPRATVRFLTPTELKSSGTTASGPDFPILFARLRDRLSTLRALYGEGAFAIDFRALGHAAASVRTVRTDLQWENAVRRSRRTGQVHSLGGFTGEAEYEGDLGLFLPWLRAGHWVGVGRHTVWGKGDFVVIT